MPVHDLNDYIRLSASLNFQLSALDVCWEDILDNITGGKLPPEAEQNLLIKTMKYAAKAYAGRHRKLGPLYILHPLRTVALLSNVTDAPVVENMLVALLHDKLEDITEDSCKEQWAELEGEFQAIIGEIDPEKNGRLLAVLDYLTRRPESGETYYNYISRLKEGARELPELVMVKLADRLDNTLDMRIDVRDPVGWTDFYARVFELLFVRGCPTYHSEARHSMSSRMNGADRMYELFKNVITLSLIRQPNSLDLDRSSRSLFEAICLSSIREAQRIIMHIFGHHLKDTDEQRLLMVKTMDYCIDGGIDMVTAPTTGHPLDGFLIEVFDHPDPKIRVQKRQTLYEDKRRMVMGACAFIVIFLRFMHQPEYYLEGISSEGLRVT